MNPGHCRNDLCGAPLLDMRSDAVWCCRACAMAQRRRASANVARTRRAKPSGRQVAYGKAVAAALDMLRFIDGRDFSDDQLRNTAVAFMRGALPERQRTR